MSVWVDFKTVKEAVKLDAVLAHYRVSLEQSKNGLRGNCPLPSHGRSRNTFTADTARSVWSCHDRMCAESRNGKKGGNVLDFVSAMEDCGVREAALKLVEWFSLGNQKAASVEPATEQPQTASVDQGTNADVSEKRDSDIDAAQLLNTCVNKPLGFELRGIDPSHPYLAERGIERETAETFGVGFFPGKGSMTGRIVFPVKNWEGQLVGYAGRLVDNSLETDENPRYKFPKGFRKSLEVWNLHAVRFRPENGPVILVEGFFDCLRVSQSGFPSVALMGCALSDAQEAALARFRSVVLMLDGDEPGRKASAEIASRLVHTSFVRVVDLPGVQPDQLSADEIRRYLAPCSS